MKRRQRKQVLDINGETDSPRRRWPNERQGQNGSPNNPLANLLGQYNSDSEAEDENRPRVHKLNDQVNDFLKEIQSIAPDSEDNQNTSMPHPALFWQECYDEQTGYPYYWHTETNQVTWEMPPELKMYHEKSQRDSSAAHGSHIPQWPKIPPNKYAQNNIPEGMIPKEVVARNRNRQAGIINQPAKPPVKTNNSRHSTNKDEDSGDEGKIEMITSFGNDESESDESEREEPKTHSNPKKHIKPPAPLFQDSSNKSAETNEPKSHVGPSLPTMLYGPQNKEKISERLSQSIYLNKPSSNSKNEDDILKKLKNQAKFLQQSSGRISSRENLTDSDSGKDLKLSLVPGYEDDSDGDDESGLGKKSIKPLFPISETSSSDINTSERLTRKIETGTSNIRVYEYRGAETTEEKVEEVSRESENGGVEENKVDLESKANKFLESIDAPSKAFQRKKRIAFDVAPNKSKSQETQESNSKDEASTDSASVSPVGESGEHRGFGFSKEESNKSSSVENDKPESEKLSNTKKPTIAFVKSAEEEEVSNSTTTSSTTKAKEVSEADKTKLKELTEPIMEKLKFLSEGSPAASAVQIMAIQLQTLMYAWESGDLQESYLHNWLVGTGCELTRLEQTAAPPGWDCQWDRSHKRYYYRNTSTNEAQWTYPQTDIVGGTEEMELCTTPPPPEHEEAPIIEMSAQAATVSTELTTTKEKSSETTEQVSNKDTPVPPPPIISSPSPPPPPRIYAEDLKRNRKRKGSPDISNSDIKGDKSSKDGKPEPLPPGIESPEIAYTLPAAAIDATVLYGAQQATNPIYAATLAGAGISLLPHHHTTLMQGQLMHYSPAYHTHLHNQALVARLSGQDAVQFMVAEYARVYENNQVITKPPVKTAHEASLGSAINSFYSDIASIEKSSVDIEREKIELRQADSTPSPLPQVPLQDNDLSDLSKEKKKKKLKTGIGKKQKEMSSMVAKWQRAQKNYKEGH